MIFSKLSYILFTTILPSVLFAQSSISIPASLEKQNVMISGIANADTVVFDLNHDGRLDLKMTYAEGVLKSAEWDENFDAKFDRVESYFQGPHKSGNLFKEVEIDLNNDGRFDTTKQYKYLSDSKIAIKTSADLDFDGKDDEIDERTLPYLQFEHIGLCPERTATSPLDKNFKNFSADLTKILGKSNDDFFKLNNNHKIHNSCFQNFGKEFFLNTYRESFIQGFQCMDRLDKLHKKQNRKSVSHPFKNSILLQQLWQKQGLKITCGESHFNINNDSSPSDAFAYASHENNEKNSDGVLHPFISINPDFPPKKYNFPKIKIEKARKLIHDKLKQILFHEAFHNLGQLHGDELEFAYTCETCCLGNEGISARNKELSCKLCSGNYPSSKDANYQKDIREWAQINDKDIVLPGNHNH